MSGGQADITLRPAKPEDLAAIQAIATAAFSIYSPRLPRPPAPVTAPYKSLIELNRITVLCEGGEVAGFVVLLPMIKGDPEEPDHLMLDILAVSPDHQGKGFGGILVRHSEDVAREKGLAEVHLYTNEAMIENLAFYTRLGFTETHRAEQDGYRRIFFTKTITGDD